MLSFTEKVLGTRVILDLLLLVVYSVWISQQISNFPLEQIDFASFMGLLAIGIVAIGVLVETALYLANKKDFAEDVRDAEIRLRGNSMTLYFVITIGSLVILTSFLVPDLFLLVHLIFYGGVSASIFNSASRIYISRFGVLV